MKKQKTNKKKKTKNPIKTKKRSVNKARGLFSNPISKKTFKKSYSPTINEKLISLRSTNRGKIEDCNNNAAFKLAEPLKIAIPGQYYGKNCHKYNSEVAKKFLLHNLSANKHIDPKIVVPPIQIQSNCWFNTMFASLFISDKGRKFFHYFRSLMIESKQANGTDIPGGLADAFALLNFAVESALTGSKYAYELNTNNIIKKIYDEIPDKYHKKYPYIVGIDEASNPIQYYGSIINYLDENSLQFLFISRLQTEWKQRVEPEISRLEHKPHVIIFEIYDADSKSILKPDKFTIGESEYKLDSAVIRDTSMQHFCATITCEGKEMGYDGMSYHRLVPMQWKNAVNTNNEWRFEGSNNSDGSPLKWSFTQGYQMLLYYRVK